MSAETPPRADAHVHFFEGGYRDSFTARPGVAIDEAACYDSLRTTHGVEAALIVGYGAAPWCANNNAFIASATAPHPWARPVAYADLSRPPTVETLRGHAEAGFVGLSFYVFEPEHRAALAAIADDVWRWLVDHRWLISVNARGENFAAWRSVLERHGALRLLISHLGLPPAAGRPPDERAAEEALGHLTELAPFEQTRVKLSGFYALTEPGYDYPHESAWPYVRALKRAFGAERLLWGSDFAPHLDHLSFPQTVDLFAKMPFLTGDDRRLIEGGSLLSLLGEVA